MFVISFIENRTVLLCQFRKQAPSEGDAISIKGRKGKVVTVESVDDKHIHVQVALKTIDKTKLAALDNSKKKKK
ncbi:hypothetical protein [Mesobacillus maritimus]|uniref:hypothetical protein n=1 Tax=Mesobacillus maritimus TaxID=1643336 RepID=UPI00384D05F5